MKPIGGPSTESVEEFRSAVLRHYDRHRRDLPWRGESDPYRVLVSETMLQQTRTETVERYYELWLARFPDLASLAEADEHDVLKAWEGLGYYRRARYLRRTAQIVREGAEGVLPGSYPELKKLPGVGEYTAGAVASIAFGERVPAVDGNVRRVLARIHDATRPKPTWLRKVATRLLDPDRPGDWNQALMDLGATVCTPRGPRCHGCPAAPWCLALARGTQEHRPVPIRRPSVRRVVFALAILREERGRVLMERRPNDGLLGGLWAFPERELAAGREVDGEVRSIASSFGLPVVGAPMRLEAYDHRFSHMHATYVPCLLEVCAGPAPPGVAVAWIDPLGDIAVALPAAQKGIIDRLRRAEGATAGP